MRKEYSTPATQAQSMTMCQLMVGSYIPSMIINDSTISGSDSEGIIYGG